MILEGGCGSGINVVTLVNKGYKCIGIDYAKDTVGILNRYMPELDIRFGDVRKLPFLDHAFIGYWSWGVIEHFWEGYAAIASEIFRVLKENGYLFLVVPYMSPLRKLKARLCIYDLWLNQFPTDFYQFVFDPGSVIKYFKKVGFQLVKALPFDCIKGVKYELPIVEPWLKKLYAYNGTNLFLKGIRIGLDTIISPIGGHSILLIFKKFAI